MKAKVISNGRCHISDEGKLSANLYLEIKPENKEIDWEQRRYEIAKDVLCACIQYDGYDVNEIDCIYIADSLIEELKKK